MASLAAIGIAALLFGDHLLLRRQQDGTSRFFAVIAMILAIVMAGLAIVMLVD